jgi:predicted nucleotidyltransferase component of viral defense system
MNWLKLSLEERKKIIDQISIQIRLLPQSIEKDWWVTMVLKALFSMPFAHYLSFKGGTSLSKCWNLIERFSEDVDIAIDREFLGFAGELTKTQISDKLRRASCSFVRSTLINELEEQLLRLGIDKSLFTLNINITSVTTTDPEIIEVKYQSIFPNVEYVQNRVLVEISGRSMNEPLEEVEINSMISDAFPNAQFSEKSFVIKAVSPKRTFLEKACLLHEEFAHATSDIRVARMSRHIYDLEKLMDTKVADEALKDIELYKSVIEHRKKFMGLKGFDYATLLPQCISFTPPEEVLSSWKDDYIKMQSSMIYGDSLPFEQLITRIEELNMRFRKIKFV